MMAFVQTPDSLPNLEEIAATTAYLQHVHWAADAVLPDGRRNFRESLDSFTRSVGPYGALADHHMYGMVMVQQLAQSFPGRGSRVSPDNWTEEIAEVNEYFVESTEREHPDEPDYLPAGAKIHDVRNLVVAHAICELGLASFSDHETNINAKRLLPERGLQGSLALLRDAPVYPGDEYIIDSREFVDAQVKRLIQEVALPMDGAVTVYHRFRDRIERMPHNETGPPEVVQARYGVFLEVVRAIRADRVRFGLSD